MRNTQVKNLRVAKNPNFYTEGLNRNITMTPEEEAKFMEHIDMEYLNKKIEEIEKTEDNPNEWIPFDKAMDEIKREVLNE